ncbi:MAG: hypothetical protein GY790_07255 [Bacteroidetes bacterium]|nr:hypothetical protein [Bacteroidota bacterium]
MRTKNNTGHNYGFSFLLFLCMTLSLSARENEVLERIHLRTDRDLYVVGESIHFKAFILNGNTPAQIGDILYLELMDKQHSPVVQRKFAISDAECFGAFSLPSELGTGSYYLRAYTSWMKNYGPESFAYQLLTVINPFEEIASDLIAGTDGEINPVPDEIMDADPIAEMPGIEIHVDIRNEQSTTRQRISLDIEAVDVSGDPVEGSFILSIARKGMLGSGNRKLLSPSSRQSNSATQDYPPEWGGHYVSGKIQPRSGDGSFQGDTLLYSVVGKKAAINYSISDDQGNFGFLVDKLEGMHEVVIQNLNPGKSGYRIHLNNPFSESYAEVDLPTYQIDTNMLDEINQAVIAAQIHALYREELQQISIDSNLLSFYGTPDKELIMANYMKLPEMWEVFFELIPMAQMRIKDDEVIIRLKNENLGKYPEAPPLLLVDGVITPESRDVANLNPLKLERIEMVTDEYYFGVLKIPGIISFITREGRCPVDYPHYYIRQAYDFLSPDVPFTFPVYKDSGEQRRPQADFRNTLYWNPRIRTNKEGKANIEFYSSDEATDFTYILEGFSPDGRYGRYSGTISVQDR